LFVYFFLIIISLREPAIQMQEMRTWETPMVTRCWPQLRFLEPAMALCWRTDWSGQSNGWGIN